MIITDDLLEFIAKVFIMLSYLQYMDPTLSLNMGCIFGAVHKQNKTIYYKDISNM